MWILEFQHSDGTWFVWLEGATLESCLEDALALKAGLHGWDYKAARLSFERPR